MGTQWIDNAVTQFYLYNPEWARSVLGEDRIQNSLQNSVRHLTPEDRTLLYQRNTEVMEKAANTQKATEKAAREAAENEKIQLLQKKTLKDRYVDPDAYFGLGDSVNSLNYLAETFPNQVNLALKVFLGLVVVLLIAWIIFKSVSVNQRNTYLKNN